MLGKLCLLGTPRVEQSEGVLTLNLNKPTLLLLYLAYRGDWVSRSEAAFLFRPDDDEVTALTQLRLLLHRAKPYTWAHTLEALPQQLRFSPITDVVAFKAAIDQQDWGKAIELYGGPLLGSHSPPDLPIYGAWLELERSNLQSAHEGALLYHAQALENQNNYPEASKVLQELLHCDPLAETVVQAYLRTSYLAGQAEKALEVYRTFRQAIQKELGLEPLPQTQALVQSIQEGKPLISPVSLIPFGGSIPSRLRRCEPQRSC